MKLSDGVEWAIHCTALLAALPEGAALTGAVLAEYHGVSPTYLLKHLKALTAAGILESLPGPRGGYRLGRPAGAINYLQIVQAIEGAAPAFRCTEIRQRGPICGTPAAYAAPCAIHVTMLRAEAAYQAELARHTIAGLAEHLRTTLDPRLQALSAAWLGERMRGGVDE